MSFVILTSGPCPRCAEENSYKVTQCKRCEYRLPWADKLEGIVRPPRRKSNLELKWEALLTRLHLLSKMDCRCRYCDRVIDAEAIECPYCDRYLTVHDRNIGDW